jgi:hypothetical protein
LRSRSCERAALLRHYVDHDVEVAAASVAGCAIDRQRQEYRQDQRDRIRRELRCLYLGRKFDTANQRRAYVEELGRIHRLLDDWS